MQHRNKEEGQPRRVLGVWKEKKKMYKIITTSMSLQSISILTQPQPWQGSAGVRRTLSLDQTLKDNKAGASARHPAQQKPIAATRRDRFPPRARRRVGGSGNNFDADFWAAAGEGSPGRCCRVVCWRVSCKERPCCSLPCEQEQRTQRIIES